VASASGVPEPARVWASEGTSVFLAPTLEQPLNAYDAATGSVVGSYGSPGQFRGGVFGAANGILYAIEDLGALHAFEISRRGIVEYIAQHRLPVRNPAYRQ
jgi:outer membrane protein assembly factor BamB